MDERTEILVSLGVATAINCVPCFRHLLEKAIAVGMGSGDIENAVEIARKVSKGASMAMNIQIDQLMGKGSEEQLMCGGEKVAVDCGCL